MRTFLQFLAEVSQEDIDRVNPDRGLHFDDIFGDRLRIVVPLDQDETLRRIADELEGLGYEVDHHEFAKNKTVQKRVRTREGEKLRPEKVGKALQAAGKAELLDWWQKNADAVGRRDTGSSIVISRSPIDLLRMSDHDGISSCHSPDGSFFKCARQEARTGGAVAYVVKNSDLKGVDLQEDEIFKDRDRDVPGIVPLERLRLRRFSKGGASVLVPELRTYGIKTVGFADAVNRWAKRAQQGTIGKIDPASDYEDFRLHGGSYQDNDAGKVWSNFFGVAVDGRKGSHDAREEDEDEKGDMYETAQESLRQHEVRWKRFAADVNEEGGRLFFSGSGYIEIPAKTLAGKEVFDALDRHVSRPWRTEKSPEADKPGKKTFDHIKKIIVDALKREVDGFQEDYFEAQYDGENFTFHFSFGGRDNGVGDLNDFERLLDEIDGLDSNYDDIVEKIKAALLSYGYIKHVADKLSFKHFEVEEGDDSTVFELYSVTPEKVGHVKDLMVHRHHFSYDTAGEVTFRGWDNQFAGYVNQYRALPFQVNDRMIYLRMKKQQTSGVDKEDWEGSHDWKDEDVVPVTGWVYLGFRNIYLNSEADPNFVARLKYLDDNWDFYMRKLHILFERFVADLRRVEQWKRGRGLQAGARKLGPDASTMGLQDMMAAGHPEAGIQRITGQQARDLRKKPEIRDAQGRLPLKFKEWLELLVSRTN